MAITLDQLKHICSTINEAFEARNKSDRFDVVRGLTGYTFVKIDAQGWRSHLSQDQTGKDTKNFLTGFLSAVNFMQAEPEAVDLLEHVESLPDVVQDILESYSLEDMTYNNCENLQAELHAVGYSIEYGLDAEPFNLRKL